MIFRKVRSRTRLTRRRVTKKLSFCVGFIYFGQFETGAATQIVKELKERETHAQIVKELKERETHVDVSWTGLAK